NWWVIETAPNSKPMPTDPHPTPEPQKLPELEGTRRLTSAKRSPIGNRIAYLDAEKPTGPLVLFCRCGEGDSATARPVSRMATEAFQWARDGNSFWVLADIGAEQPVGRLYLDGRFDPISQG